MRPCQRVAGYLSRSSERDGVNVTFKHWGPHVASSRYRAIIPAQQLHKLGVGLGKEWLVIGKHGWDWATETSGFTKVCFDVCDDHFEDSFGDHYRACISRADLVTCNSLEMARLIKDKTDRKAAYIPDPYEQREREPRVHDQLLWFGHQSNLPDLIPWVDKFEKLEIVTGGKIHGAIPWTPESMDRAFDRAGLVIIPTGKSMAKSGNRAIESLRRGIYVVAGSLPAYGSLGIYTGNLEDGVSWCLSHREEVLSRIARAQDYIRFEYSPERIAGLWKQALFG
jgi:hypothetical protein